MNEKIKNHIDMLFENAPKTRRAFELKEELLTNTEERYRDLLANGVTPEDATKNVINSIGDVSELFQGLEDSSAVDKEALRIQDRKAAMIKAVAAGIYIFGIAVLLFFVFVEDITRPAFEIPGLYNHMDYSLMGLILMIIIDIVPTCMLVYISSIYPKYQKKEDTVVEDFKEWKSSSNKEKSIKNAIRTIIWSSAIFIYFAISFATYDWYVTWIVFLAAICVQASIELLFYLKKSA